MANAPTDTHPIPTTSMVVVVDAYARSEVIAFPAGMRPATALV